MIDARSGPQTGYNLADAISTEYRRVYASNTEDITELGVLIAKWLAGRQPPRGLPPEELERWEQSAPQTFVVIDDLHLLSVDGGSRTVLAPLVNDIKRAPGGPACAGRHHVRELALRRQHEPNHQGDERERRGADPGRAAPGRSSSTKCGRRLGHPVAANCITRQGGGQLVQVAQ